MLLSIIVGGGGVSDLSEELVWGVCASPDCWIYLCSIVLKSWMVVNVGCLQYCDAILCMDSSTSCWAWFGLLSGASVGIDVGASALHSKESVMCVMGVPVLDES